MNGRMKAMIRTMLDERREIFLRAHTYIEEGNDINDDDGKAIMEAYHKKNEAILKAVAGVVGYEGKL